MLAILQTLSTIIFFLSRHQRRSSLTQNHELPSQLKAMIVLNRYFVGSVILAMELLARKVMAAFA